MSSKLNSKLESLGRRVDSLGFRPDPSSLVRPSRRRVDSLGFRPDPSSLVRPSLGPGDSRLELADLAHLAAYPEPVRTKFRLHVYEPFWQAAAAAELYPYRMGQYGPIPARDYDRISWEVATAVDSELVRFDRLLRSVDAHFGRPDPAMKSGLFREYMNKFFNICNKPIPEANHYWITMYAALLGEDPDPNPSERYRRRLIGRIHPPKRRLRFKELAPAAPTTISGS